MHRISYVQKIGLVIFGVFVCLVLLEGGLRLAAVAVSPRASGPRHDAAPGVLRIVCIGESTTFFGGEDSYPAQLEAVLGQRLKDKKVEVLNRGLPGTTSAVILAKLEGMLEEDRPDIVIAMIGVNEHRGTFEYRDTVSSRLRVFLDGIKVYRLAMIAVSRVSDFLAARRGHGRQGVSIEPDDPRLLPAQSPPWQSTAPQELAAQSLACLKQGRSYDEQGLYKEAEESFQKAIVLHPGNSEAYIGLGWVAWKTKRYPQAEEFFRKALEIEPSEEEAYIGLGYSFVGREEYSQAEASFKEAIALNPKSAGGYSGLSAVYASLRQFDALELLGQEYIRKNPGNEWGYIILGNLYNSEGLYDKAEAEFRKALAMNPQNYNVYQGLGESCLNLRRYSEAERVFRYIAENNTGNPSGYVWLGRLYLVQERFPEAAQVLEKARAIAPDNSLLWRPLAESYMKSGEYGKAEEVLRHGLLELRDAAPAEFSLGLLDCYLQQKKDRELGRIYSSFVRNYRRIYQLVQGQRAVFVCVQYPTLALAPLRQIFAGAQDIIFVDNERVFNDAVARDGYEAYFTDRLGQSFGHCTRSGNRLLAENIADALADRLGNRR